MVIPPPPGGAAAGVPMPAPAPAPIIDAMDDGDADAPLIHVYVGRIPPALDEAGEDDVALLRLLGVCGEVRNWRRVQHPLTGDLRAFGFAQFEEPGCCEVAAAALDGAAVAGSRLMVRPNGATRAAIDAAARSRDPALAEAVRERTGAAARAARALVDELHAAHPAAAAAHAALLREEKKREEAPSRRAEPDVAGFLSGMRRRTMLDLSEPPAASASEQPPAEQPPAERPAPADQPAQPRTRVLVLGGQRPPAARARAPARGEHEWLQRERESQRARERERERERESERARRDRVRRDEEATSEDEAREARRVRRATGDEDCDERREREARRRRRAREREEDDAMRRRAGGGVEEAAVEKEKAAVKLEKPAVKIGFRVQAAIVAQVDDEDDEDDGRPARRPIIPIDYSVEELAAAHMPATDDINEEAAGERPKPEAVRSSLEKAVPTDREAVLRTPVEWDSLLAEPDGLSIIDAWLRRKLTELLGEEEESMIEFITDSLSSRCEPAALLEELEPVFDDAAAEFTAELWRTVVLESLYAKHGV